MEFFGYPSVVNDTLKRFAEATNQGDHPLSILIKEKLALCDYKVLLIPNVPYHSDNLCVDWFDSQELMDLHNAWECVRGEGLTNMIAQKCAWEIINKIGGVLSDNKGSSSMVLRSYNRDKGDNHFFILLTGKERDGLPTFELLILCNYWQIKNGRYPFHAAGVIHHEKLFLFGGPSGAGKSTIAKVSESFGDKVLDEDQVLLLRTFDGNYKAQAWGYSLQKCDVPLQAVFKLIQDDENQLLPLTQSQTASFLTERAMEVMGSMFSDDLIKHIFRQVAEIARCVPGYELHFRKTPDFWNLIDERFST
jgi:hypothetical protein